MRKPWDAVKIKILLGYFFLVGISGFTVWLIYSEILVFTENESRFTRLNNKILYFNSVLTNLYQAEALERTYSQTGSQAHYQSYEKLMDAIYLQFDTLSRLSDNPREKLHIDSILLLLDTKRHNLRELGLLKKTSSGDLYEKAMDRFNINRDSISALLNIRTTITDKSESTFVEQKKRKFFERLAYAFNPKEAGDSVVTVNKQQIVQTDTIINEISPTDSLIQFFSSIMQDIRRENEDSKNQLAKKQSEVLASDRTITLQLRQMLSIFEKDIFINSLLELNTLQERIRLTTWNLVGLGLLALFVIIFFLILILKDITRSKRYRHELEIAKAYSDSLLRSKEQIMLSITHDIKSPLASVIGYSQLMNETENKSRKDYYLTNINKSADHILKLISDLVDLTRLETGKLKFDNSRFNLYELINEVCSGFYPMAASKNLEFRLEYDISDYDDYFSDPVRLKQVLANVISNAVKYTDKGSVRVKVHHERSDDKFDFLVFEIIDTGIGISEDDSKIIFNEFTRLTDRKKYEGAGLGLSIAHRIVSLLNGTITVKSQPGAGSTFEVRLPLERSNRDEIKQVELIPGQELEKQIKIIVIDDDEVFLDLTGELLVNSGMNVQKCTTALQAIQLVDQFKPDLILTDLQMPSMNGIDMLSYIQRKTGRLIPVILITGQESPDKSEIVLSAVLKKPFHPSELISCIHRVLKGRSGDIIEMEVPDYKHNTSGIYRYNLDQVRQFAVNDPESMHKILISFAESSYENLILFDKFIMEGNRKMLSELAHKMIAMFRQLEAGSIVELLAKIELDNENYTDEEWIQLGRESVKKIGQFINVFCEEQRIHI